MIDRIEYQTINGQIEKTYTGKAQTINVKEELAALEAQLSDFKKGQEIEYSDEVAQAIVNYEEQIAFLKGK